MNGTLSNSEDPDVTPRNASSHQGLHYLLKRKFIYVKIMKKKVNLTPPNEEWTLPKNKDGRIYLA